MVYADGNEVPYRCSLHPQCKLGSTLVIRCVAKISESWAPLNCTKRKTDCSAQLTAPWERVLRSFIRADPAGQYERQKALLTQSEIKLLHAQVNPHFLFNALNTIKAVIRRDSEQASQLVQYLSTFFAKI